MATTTPTKEETEDNAPQELTGLRARMAQMHNPGLYVGSGLGIASGWLSGDPLLYTTLGTTGAAAAWAALGMNPGPWRWLPGQGEPWEWACRSSRRGYRRRVRRMRRRLERDHGYEQAVGSDGLFVIGVVDGWRHREDRAALVRAAKTDSYRTRAATLRAIWAKALPDWERGWWRRYSPTEMALRAGPLAVIPASSYIDVPWWARLLVASTAATWGAQVWALPDSATPAADEHPDGIDWYLGRWDEWIACEQGPLPGSKLADVHLDEDKLTAIIVSTTARPALGVGQDAVSIAFEVPPRSVNIYRPDDMAASRAKLTVKLRSRISELDMDDLAAVWEEYSPYHGSELYDAEETEFGRRFKLLMPRRGASVADVQPLAIAQALDMDGADAVSHLHLRVIDARRIEVNEMSINPLQDGVPLDPQALVMDDQGYVTVGKDIYGDPARWRLMIPNEGKFGLTGQQGMSAVHSFSSGTTGSGKSSLEETLLIAQMINGIVGWLADGKYGAGFASWTHVLDWMVKSHYGAMLMGQAAVDVGKFRFSTQMKMQWQDADGYVMDGRSFFVPGEPFAPMQVTWDEFNEMVMDPAKDHVNPLLAYASNLGRQTRSAGMGARVYVQIPNLDSIGTNKHANAIRDMLQSGNIALFRTARADIDVMSLGSRTPKFRLEPIPETFPNGSGTGGLGYIADGSDQYTQSRMMFHPNPVRIARELPRPTLTTSEADAIADMSPAGIAYLRRDEYRHMDAGEEEEFLRDLVKQEEERRGKNTTVVDLAPAPTIPGGADMDVEDEDLDELVPPSRSELVWRAVDRGARRNKQISEATSLKPTNVANATKRLQRLGKLTQIDRDWHTVEPIDA
ncbi:hypothetical protein [Streptomyces sp. DH10]|uniref:hypothetical protein n=1 Tax=Streptomyces sp. DH10 TaxID=3040121 RepID=UPI00244249C4|nr:hypothetical protein [Streptomyces sp. DH10]MDG9709692.1 hypothetical protein [Streptomyces sp. DH10]